MEYVKRNNIDDSTIFTGKSAHEKVREQWLSAEKNWKLISSEISFTNKDRENFRHMKAAFITNEESGSTTISSNDFSNLTVHTCLTGLFRETYPYPVLS